MLSKYLILSIIVSLSLAHENLLHSNRDAGLNHRAEFSYSFQPRHVHLAYGANTSEVVVTWSTEGFSGNSIVNYGRSMFRLDDSARGNSTLFVDATKVNKQWIHRVHLFNLPPDTTFFYQVGGPFGWSSVFGFKTVPAGTTGWPLRFAAFGDLGVVNAKSLTRLQREAHVGMYDLILHVGDFAYNFYEKNGYTGDEFMKQIEPVAAYLPYMTCPGNHEHYSDFHQYRNRFSMPDYANTENLYFSFNVGPVHFVAVSTEVYYYGPQILSRVVKQWLWLQQDLKEANKPDNRRDRPWIVLFGHRPMYCTNDDHDDCRNHNTKTRVGLPAFGNNTWFGMEELLKEHGVDVAVWAHEHSFERFYPMFNYTYYNEGDPYVNPKAPVHITTGSAGCREFITGFVKSPPAYSARRVAEYGYSRFTVFNHTHLHIEQINATSGDALDEVMIISEGPRIF